MADMNALVADAENYLHVGTDNNGKMQADAQNFNGFPNAGGVNDSFYQVILRIRDKSILQCYLISKKDLYNHSKCRIYYRTMMRMMM